MGLGMPEKAAHAAPCMTCPPRIGQTLHVGNSGIGRRPRGNIKETTMTIGRSGSALFVQALALGICSGSGAFAADLPVKAPPPPPAVEFDVHGFADVSFKNDYI